jgi:DNA gyrase/topoisomerase IV subunit A
VNLDDDLEKRLDDNELREKTLRNIELESAVARMNLDARISGVLDDRGANISDRLANIEGSGEVAREVKAQVKAFLRVVINTLLYVNSASCETTAADNEGQRRELQKALDRKKHKNGKEAKKLARDLENLPKYRVTWIGPTIETGAGSETDLTGTRTMRGHVRRGHWHTYRVGPRKTGAGERIDPAMRKASLKWVAPVWVGGGVPEDKPRVYGVREPA